MGLSRSSTGAELVKEHKQNDNACVIALAGNPNVGKSTVFNLLTGLNQHTGNWPGKTVSNARGKCRSGNREYELVDIPGTYSLLAQSEEERIARDFICFGGEEAVLLVCDAVCLERNMNLLIQAAEASKKLLVCVNLMDEAKRKGIKLDLERLSELLNLPVIGISAKKKSSRDVILAALDKVAEDRPQDEYEVEYPAEIENAIQSLKDQVQKISGGKLRTRWLCLKLLEGDSEIIKQADEYLNGELEKAEELLYAAHTEREKLIEQGIDSEKFQDMIATSISKRAAELARAAVSHEQGAYSTRDRKIDKLLTGKLVGYPLMLLLLLLVFYITIAGANYPSQLLSTALFALEEKIRLLLTSLNAPWWFTGLLVDGVYRVLAWVVSVMLPPMAIFFPLFTLLEDAGYLPRVAYNLDNPFHKCKACGKQALTMCMGFGCNAAGVIGCRIIDSERERLLAILTNSFVPCNGRFPMLITVMTMFFTGAVIGGASNFLSALMLTAFIVLSVVFSFLATKLLSSTLLKGKPSSFVLEMPPYRRPNIAQVIVRSIFDRTLFVLGRAVAVAAPAGAVIWLMAHVHIYGESLISIFANFLDPLGKFMGLDGVILIAFILGFPANEIVLPIMLMAYTAAGSLTEPGTIMEIKEILLQNGWSWITALCTMLFSLFHWPCSTTVLTIKKETGSRKWTLLSAILPTIAGFICCSLAAALARLITA